MNRGLTITGYAGGPREGVGGVRRRAEDIGEKPELWDLWTRDPVRDKQSMNWGSIMVSRSLHEFDNGQLNDCVALLCDSKKSTYREKAYFSSDRNTYTPILTLNHPYKSHTTTSPPA